MTKEDAPAPKHPPRKRYQIENQEKVPDLWLAVWATDAELPEDERQRAQDERDRRKQLKPDKIIGVLVDAENITPDQRDALMACLAKARPTEIHHPWTTGRVIGACKSAGVPVVHHHTLREVVLESMLIVVAPRAPEYVNNRTPAWEGVAYARHRKLPVTVVLPDGTIE